LLAINIIKGRTALCTVKLVPVILLVGKFMEMTWIFNVMNLSTVIFKSLCSSVSIVARLRAG
jgi:hypothetical protein